MQCALTKCFIELKDQGPDPDTESKVQRWKVGLDTQGNYVQTVTQDTKYSLKKCYKTQNCKY